MKRFILVLGIISILLLSNVIVFANPYVAPDPNSIVPGENI